MKKNVKSLCVVFDFVDYAHCEVQAHVFHKLEIEMLAANKSFAAKDFSSKKYEDEEQLFFSTFEFLVWPTK